MFENAKIIGFALTTDFDRAKDFYVGKLGLEFVINDGWAMVLRSGANMVRIAKTPKLEAAQHTVLGWEVADVPAAVAALAGKGIQVEKFPWNPSPDGIMTFPNGDKVAWFKDPDGNTLSVSQHS